MVRHPLLATTLFASVLSAGVAHAQPVTGLYIAGAGGANFRQDERVISSTTFGVTTPSFLRGGFETGVVGVGSLGYGFGNGLRIELEGNYRNNRLDPGQGAGLGIVSLGGRQEQFGPMFNVMFDLDVGSPYVFPYLGAGAGYTFVNFKSRNTTAFGVSTLIDDQDASFAYQAMVGLSFPIPPVRGLSLTAEYRFHALTGERDINATTTGLGAPVRSNLRVADVYNHGLMLGLRYAFNTAPPPVPAPVPVARPAQEDARTYLVFFDWDRADLTDRARQIINEAAQATTRVAVTRIEVAGHTDKSGSDRYNQGLSQRRAQNVAAELVRLGVPRAAITTQAFGESRPLVQTADGVREPQNRRVEIVLR